MHKVIISGGGTGGHVFPAIAIGKELKNRVPDIEILYVGAKGKLEMKKVPKAGFEIIGLWISGFHRQLTLRNLMFPIKLVWSLIQSYHILNKFKPDLVIGVGGYASGAIMKVAAWKGIPIMIQEQNSYAGVTNKLVAEDAKAICVAYDNMDQYFDKAKVHLTGNPIRSDLIDLKIRRADALNHFDLQPHFKTILVLGGSLGARSINNAISAGLVRLGLEQDVQMIWQVGKLYFDEFSNRRTNQVKIRAFIDRMDLAYKVADVVISRAGALSVSELCLIGKPTILVPSPNVAEDHQTKNAAAIVEANGAIMINDKLAKDTLLNEALTLLEDEAKQKTMSTNIKALAKPDATSDIVDIALKILKS